MKKIIILSLFSAFFFSHQVSLAESYPTTCPTEAQAVLKAVGGCSAIDCKVYSNICAKCCVTAAAPAKTATPTVAPTLTPKPAVVPSTDSQPSQSSGEQAGQAATPSESSLPASTPSIQENLPAPQTGLSATTTSEETAAPTPKIEPIISLINFVKSIFTGFFRFFGFGK